MSSALRLLAQNEDGTFNGMVGKHPAMTELFDGIRRAAPLPAPVLVEGQTGVGKELVVQALHVLSGVRGPLVSLNVTTLSEQLVESELFGVVRGAYTGATADREGLFTAADGGTLYLDEAGDLALGIQVRLLRAIETGMVRPVGGARERSTRVRLVVSTQRPPAQLMAQGRWRPDFYYRVAGIALRVPCLAERPTDIPLLADHFLARMGAPILPVGAAAALADYPWPGNVRQLIRALERAVFRNGLGAVTVHGILDSARELDSVSLSATLGEGLTLREMERRQIEAVLAQAGTTREAAALLGLSSYQLYRRLRAFGLRPLGAR